MACFPSEIAILLSDQNYVGSKSVKVPHPLPWRTCNEVDLAPCLSRSLVRNKGFVSNNKVLISKRLVSSSIVPTRHGPAAAGKTFNISHITIPGTALTVTPHTHISKQAKPRSCLKTQLWSVVQRGGRLSQAFVSKTCMPDVTHARKKWFTHMHMNSGAWAHFPWATFASNRH